MSMNSNSTTSTPRSINTENGVFQTWIRNILFRLRRRFQYRDPGSLPVSSTSGNPAFNRRRMFQCTPLTLQRIRHFTRRQFSAISATTMAETLWRTFDTVVLLGMGSGYIIRFDEFTAVSEGEGCDILIREWRDEQQDEWNRLSTTLAILATMHAAILAISPNAPPLAFSLWLGGASLSVCGLFIVQYFPIKAFSIRDVDMPLLLGVEQDENGLISATLLIIAVSSPAAMLMWAALLFVVGMADYIVEVDMLDIRFKCIAAVPLGVGVLFMILTVGIGEVIERRLRVKNKIV